MKFSQEKYEQLKKVIQTANPEIMELKFGCEVKIFVIGIEKITAPDWSRFHDKEEWWETAGGFAFNAKGDEYEILGRPIRLADVLLAFQKNKISGARISIDEDGSFAIDNGNIRMNHPNARWNLKDDNLDHQSDETKQFLIDLLT